MHVNSATRALFEVAKAAVRAEVERAKGDEAFGNSQGFNNPQPGPPNYNQSSFNNTAGPKPASPKQIRFLYQLGKRAGLSNEQVNAFPGQYFNKTMNDLTSREAYQLIESLNQGDRKAA